MWQGAMLEARRAEDALQKLRHHSARVVQRNYRAVVFNRQVLEQKRGRQSIKKFMKVVMMMSRLSRAKPLHDAANVLRCFLEDHNNKSNLLRKIVGDYVRRVSKAQRLARSFLACRAARMRALEIVWDRLATPPSKDALYFTGASLGSRGKGLSVSTGGGGHADFDDADMWAGELTPVALRKPASARDGSGDVNGDSSTKSSIRRAPQPTPPPRGGSETFMTQDQSTMFDVVVNAAESNGIVFSKPSRRSASAGQEHGWQPPDDG